MGVCSISKHSKEARSHYGVPNTSKVLHAKTESHGLCSVCVRCERGCRVLSLLAEKNSQPTHEHKLWQKKKAENQISNLTLDH